MRENKLKKMISDATPEENLIKGATKLFKAIQKDIDRELQALAATSKKAFDLFSKVEAAADEDDKLWEAADGILMD